MTAPETQWVFDTVAGIVDDTALAWGAETDVPDGAVPVRRVDRNESEIYDGDIRTRKSDLQTSNYISAALVDDDESHGGFGDDYNAEAIVALRIEGLHHREWGHIDPDGADGIDFTTFYRRVREALQADDEWPSVAGADYHTAFLENGTNRSQDYRDFYEYRVDVRLSGYADS
ncbi:hypothetical protein [Halorubrum halodurans]|uniref:Uncharacterized protein n=1 Tax=Halorubrum halodurans TaxID=1383851 RepID=A0A256ICR6_9EURY|nr:hypothetical protein [Halorubrum halodurans]OYR54328.1 hypothetical protein DJ70_14180 [Halorubrum halodurans]